MSARSHGSYRLNIKFLGWLTLVVAVTCAGFWGLHRYQSKRLTSSFLTQADQAAKENDSAREISYLEQYIALNPTNTAARARLGMTLAKNYKTGNQGRRAYFLLEQVLADEPNIKDSKEIRIQCVKLILNPGLGLPSHIAVQEIENDLLPNDPNNPKLNEYYYLALMNSNEYKKALLKLEDYIQRNPGDPDAYIRKAWLMREKFNETPKNAEFVVKQMVDHVENRNEPKAWLRAATYYKYFQMKDYPNTRTGTLDAMKDANFFQAVKRAAETLRDKPDAPRLIAAEIHLYQADAALMRWRASQVDGERPKPNKDFDDAMVQLKLCLQRLEPLPRLDPLPEFGTEEFTHVELAAQTYRNISQNLTMAERFEEAEEYARKQVERFPEKVSYLFVQMQLELLDVLVRRNKLAEAEVLAAKLEKAKIAPAFVELQWGFIEAQRPQPDWIKAIGHFDRCETELANNKDLSRRVKAVKIICLEKTNQFDVIVQEYREAIPRNRNDPAWAPMTVAFAQALAKLNRNREAIQELKKVLDQDATTKLNLPEVRNRAVNRLMVSLMIVEKARGAKAFASDPEIEEQLALLPDDADRAVLRARFDAVKGKPQAARQGLEAALAKEPGLQGLYVSLFQLELQEKQFDAAEAVLKRFQAKFPAAVEGQQMQMALSTAGREAKPRPSEEVRAGLEAVARTLPNVAKEKRPALLRSLAGNARIHKQFDLARKYLELLIVEIGNFDLDVYYQMLDLAMFADNEEWMTSDLKEIERLVGGTNQPAYRLALAFKLLHDAGKPANANSKARLLQQAADQLSGLEERKDWSRLYLARGKVYDMQGRRPEALNNFVEAIRLGESHPELISRFIDLCYLEKRSKEFHAILLQKPEIRMLIGPDMEKAIDILMIGGFTAEALDLAKQAVPESSNDPKKLFWLARIQNDCKDSAGAEATMRRVSQVAFNDGNMWVGYIMVLVKNGKTAEAKKYLEETTEKLKVPEAELFVSQACALVGDYAKADALFAALLAKKPDDLPTIMAAAQYYFRTGKFGQARPLLEKVILLPNASPQFKETAKQKMALCLVAEPNHMNGLKGLELLGFKSPDEAGRCNGSESLETLRTRFAIVSVIKGRTARVASRDLLLAIKAKEAKQTLPIPEERALGQIYFALGETDKAQKHLSNAALNSPKEELATSLAIYANFLLRMADYTEAETQMRKLVAIEPNSQRAAELYSRLRVATGHPKDAENAMNKFAEANGKPEISAAVLEALGLMEAAGKLYEKAAEKSENPAMRMVYAGYLGRVGKPIEMMAEFEKAWDRVPLPLSVALLCNSMLAVSDSNHPSVVAKANDRIAAAVASQPAFKPYLAAFKSLVGKESEAIALMREILAANPNDVFTLNNLAYLLAIKEGNTAEALSLIRKAQSLVGPLPNLLDTETTILIVAGNNADAVEKITEAIIDEPSAAAFLHRAMAYQNLKKRDLARDDLKAAKLLNLRLIDFHPLERRMVDELIRELEK